MKLEISKNQKDGFSKIAYELNLTLRLTSAEYSKLTTYKLDNLIALPASKFKKRMCHAMSVLIAFFLTFLVSNMAYAYESGKRYYEQDMTNVIFWGGLTLVVSYFLLMIALNPDKKIKDLLEGCTFTCKSLQQIEEIENNIEACSIHLRKLLDDCAYWGGVELVDMERNTSPLDNEATAEKYSVFDNRYTVVRTKYKKDDFRAAYTDMEEKGFSELRMSEGDS